MVNVSLLEIVDTVCDVRLLIIVDTACTAVECTAT